VSYGIASARRCPLRSDRCLSGESTRLKATDHALSKTFDAVWDYQLALMMVDADRDSVDL
jgi:hypothetical protein